ncbi:S1C family serine protease [Bacillus marasmi]|uniref:S1C family serine protease n=1 Tax=Bacillus marasmi TaxID=1926279 RepID=UPI0011C8F404|nr:trypsin-like peptidase domain-containing protein [Bacillus marasmi]
MENFEDNQQQVTIQKASKGKQFIATVTGGIIGSVLTVAFIASPYSEQVLNKMNLETISQAIQKFEAKDEVKIDSNTQTVTAQATKGDTSFNSISDMVETASKSIVGVTNIQQAKNRYTSQNQTVKSGTGSGVIFKIVDNSAYIVTNNHVIEGASEVEITLENGQKTNAKIIGADALTDLAVLEIDAKNVSNVLSFADSSTVRAGDQVVAIGNPLGLDLSGTVTQGIVSGVDRSMSVSTSSGEWDLDVIQTDAAINPGNSGGALLNTDGQVIGINSLKISESGIEGLGFAIPSNDVIPIVNELISKGKITRPYLGVSLTDLEQIPAQYLQDLPENITNGTMVTNLNPDSAASKAGLKVQDIIVSFNETEIDGASDLRKILYTQLKVGEKVKIGVYRNGKLETITVTLTE